MLRRIPLVFLGVVASCLAQDRFQAGELKGFTKSSIEHIISRLEEPITVPPFTALSS
jgi:hypothetical protein